MLVPDNNLFKIKTVLISFLHEKHTLWVLIRSATGASNVYPQHMFSCSNKKRFWCVLTTCFHVAIRIIFCCFFLLLFFIVTHSGTILIIKHIKALV